MTTATAIRRLAAEAAQRQRIKVRIHAWWHAERCPNCARQRERFPVIAESLIDALRGHQPNEGVKFND